MSDAKPRPLRSTHVSNQLWLMDGDCPALRSRLISTPNTALALSNSFPELALRQPVHDVYRMEVVTVQRMHSRLAQLVLDTPHFFINELAAKSDLGAAVQGRGARGNHEQRSLVHVPPANTFSPHHLHMHLQSVPHNISPVVPLVYETLLLWKRSMSGRHVHDAV
jgi:hypothetical protein